MKFKTGDKHLIREINKSLILKIVRERGPISRADIAPILGLNPATVSSNIKLLLNDRLIKEIGTGESSGGRKPILLALNEEFFNCIGVDVRKDKIIAAVLNLEGKIQNRVELPLKNLDCKESIINDIIDAISRAKSECPVDDDCFFGIGVGMHGIVNFQNGISVYAPAFSWRDVNLKSILEQNFNIPVSMDNDARAMALGEKWFGIAKNKDNFVFLNVGSGIGSGIIINGELYRGKGYAAGEIGHIRVVENGVKCVCGKYGCLDTVATEKSLIKNIVESIQMGIKTDITDLVKDDLLKIDSQVVYKAAKAGDQLAIQSFEQIGRYLGIAVANVINILNPDMVIIGGKISLAGDFVFKPLIDTANILSMRDCIKNVQIVPSSLKENCGVIGAATMAIQNVFNETKLK